MLQTPGASRAVTRLPGASRIMLHLGLIALDGQTDPNAGGGGGTAAQQQHRLQGDAAVTHILTAKARNPKVIAQTMQREIDRLWKIIEEKGVPPGAVLITDAAEVKEYQAFKALGKKVEDIKKDLDRIPSLESENGELKKNETRSAAAQKMEGWNQAAVSDFLKRFGIDIEFMEVEVEDPQDKTKKVKKMMPHVPSYTGEKKDQKKLELFDTVVKRDYGVYEVALRAKPQGANGASGNSSGIASYPAAPAAGGSGSSSGEQPAGSTLASSYLNRAYVDPFATKDDEKK